MPDRAAIDAGYAWEFELAKRWGLELTPASGAGHVHKLDVGGQQIRLSAKHTTAASYRLTANEIAELDSGTKGPGARGHELGLMAIRMAGVDENVLALRESDMLAILRGEVSFTVPATKREARRAGAVPAYMREAS